MADKNPEPSPSSASTPVQDDQSGSNWWDSWLSSARTKSAEVYSMVKKDLDEIGTAVKSEASHVFSTTSTVIGKTLKLDVPESPANVMKKSFSSFIGQVSTVLNPEPDDEDDTEVILSSGDTTMLSTYKKELEALQRVDATFIVPAEGGEFAAWRASLERGASEGAAKRLGASTLLREQYERLVPDAVTEDEFWERYLFRVALLQDRLAAVSRRGAAGEGPPPASAADADPVLAHLPQRNAPVVESPKKTLSGVEDEPAYEAPGIDNTVVWEDEDFANDMELTEEQQILLLEEYEKEIESKRLSKQTSSRDITNNNTEDKTTNTTKKQTKPIQSRDKMNNKAARTTTDKKPATAKPATEKKAATDKKKVAEKKLPVEKKVRPQKQTKSDMCGNNILVEDYFGESPERERVKDDASANSDESWEKEFEIDDVVEQKA